MIANVRCPHDKCQCTGKFDVGDEVTTVEEAQAKVDKAEIHECPWGHHFELSPIRYVVESIEEGHAPTDEEWLAEMREKGYELWGTDELKESEIKLTGFLYGLPEAKIRGRNINLDFATSPSGKRYYFMLAKMYAEATGG